MAILYHGIFIQYKLYLATEQQRKARQTRRDRTGWKEKNGHWMKPRQHLFISLSALFILSLAFIIYCRFQQYNFFAENDNFVFVAKKRHFFGNVKNSILLKIAVFGKFYLIVIFSNWFDCLLTATKTTTALIRTFKTLRLNQSTASETPDSSIVQDVPSAELLAFATPSKSNEKTKRIPKKRINEENYCTMCSMKHNSKLDKDFDSPWIGCQIKSWD